MVTDVQVRRLVSRLASGSTLEKSAMSADMSEKTARKYVELGKLPSELRGSPRTWLTREDPFAEVWDEVRERLEQGPGLQAKTLLKWLQGRHPEGFEDKHLRTLQRRVREWRSMWGPAKEVFFAQVHHPGRLAASDFTHMTELGVTLAGQPFAHLVYHFVLTYSNWETASICFSESFEYRFKEAVNQALLLRGHRDFSDREEYWRFLRQLLDERNAARRSRQKEELERLQSLPGRRLESYSRRRVRVDRGALIHADRNVYSVHSRLIGEWVEVRMYAEELEVWYGGQLVEKTPRLRGRQKHHVNYRHVIDWLLRKPGAFENYRYREEMFPTIRFRLTYDALREAAPASVVRKYLQILELAARENESAVDDALRMLLAEERVLTISSAPRPVEPGTGTGGPKPRRSD